MHLNVEAIRHLIVLKIQQKRKIRVKEQLRTASTLPPGCVHANTSTGEGVWRTELLDMGPGKLEFMFIEDYISIKICQKSIVFWFLQMDLIFDLRTD